MFFARRVAAVTIALSALAVLLAGCSDDAASAAPDTAFSQIIDVRTPEEFAAGHVEGAINMNVESPAFAGEIATLPQGEELLVYCRSGNRSAVAVDLMRAQGLTVTDGGGLDDMKADGYPFTN